MPRARHSRQFWERLVAEFESGDESCPAFARRHRVLVSTFRSWLYRVRREQEVAVPHEPAMAFVEVVPLGSTTASMERASVRLVMPGGYEVEMEELPAPDYLAELSRTLCG